MYKKLFMLFLGCLKPFFFFFKNIYNYALVVIYNVAFKKTPEPLCGSCPSKIILEFLFPCHFDFVWLL